MSAEVESSTVPIYMDYIQVFWNLHVSRHGPPNVAQGGTELGVLTPSHQTGTPTLHLEYKTTHPAIFIGLSEFAGQVVRSSLPVDGGSPALASFAHIGLELNL